MRILAAIGAFAIVIAISAAVFFFGGFFNVAASEPDPAIVSWVLDRIRTASIDRHGEDLASPVDLDNPEVVRAGARAFSERGCANCHGAPGVQWQKFSEGLNPSPPDLKEIAHEEPGELFWVVKNGIKMTGMPSFGAIGVDENEIWSIVAFIRKLPNTSEADFKAWISNP